MRPDLVVVHGDVELVVEFEGLAPNHAAAPEGVAGGHALRLGGHVQDVFPAAQRPHGLPCVAPAASACRRAPLRHPFGVGGHIQQPLTSVGDHEEDVLLESLRALQPHLAAQLLDHVLSHLGQGEPTSRDPFFFIFFPKAPSPPACCNLGVPSPSPSCPPPHRARLDLEVPLDAAGQEEELALGAAPGL